MSEVTLKRIKSDHASVGELIAKYEKQLATTEYVIERAVIKLAPGARFAGVMLKADGTIDYYLILHAGDGGKLSHGDAKAYAAGLGLKVPNRREGRLLQAAFPDEFSTASIWLEEDYEGDNACAWCQDYDHGTQYYYRKSAALRAVAVSRFVPSII